LCVTRQDLIVRQFIGLDRTAPAAGERGNATCASLIDFPRVSDNDRAAAEALSLAALDDPSHRVRRPWPMCFSDAAPSSHPARHRTALAVDPASVARPVSLGIFAASDDAFDLLTIVATAFLGAIAPIARRTSFPHRFAQSIAESVIRALRSS